MPNARTLTLRLTIVVVVASTLLLAVPIAGAQQNYYVDAENGSDFNGGTSPSDAWQHVTFALSGTLIPGSTIYLVGTTSVDYSVSNGESFPWILKGNINLIGDPGGTNPNVIVDVENTGHNAVEYDPNTIVTGSLIEKITFTNCLTAIDAKPQVSKFFAAVRECTFDSAAVGFSVDVASTAQIYTTLKQNTTTTNTVPVFASYDISGGTCAGLIEDNHVHGGYGVKLAGNPVNGTLTITGNTLEVYSSAGVALSNFTGAVEVTDNIISSVGSGTGISISNCNPWHPDSRIENNDCANLSFGIRVSVADSLSLKNNSCTFCSHGIATSYCNSLVLDNNDVIDCVDAVVVGGPDPEAQIINNRILRNGYGLIVDSAQSIVSENVIEGNWAGGLWIRNASATDIVVSRNTIQANKVFGLLVDSSDIQVVQNEVFETSPGPGIQDNVCENNLYSSNIIHHNSGYGIFLNKSSVTSLPLVIHNTCADNHSAGVRSSLGSVALPYVSHSIFWDNNQGGPDMEGVSFGQYEYCDIKNGASPGHGNISLDPEFVNAVGYDYHLKSTSPCIDAGKDDRFMWKWTRDFEGQPRKLDGKWSGANLYPITDMGADEVGDTALSVTGAYLPGTPLSVEISASGQGNAPFQLWFVADRLRMPLADPPGNEFKLYGTVLLDPSKIVYGGPVLTGKLSPLGLYTNSSALSIPPSPGLVGLNIAFQALVGSASYGSGQGTPATVFTIGQ